MIDTAERLARDAGDLLQGYFGRLGMADAARKGNRRRDLVSCADVEAERLIVGGIPAADDILAEEGSGRARGAARTWIVDPLDGTVNFLHGIPFWCVSIAIRDGAELQAAVVHAPALDLTFAARRGQGCRLNGDPVQVSRAAEIGDAVLATGFPYARDTLADNNLENVPRVGVRAGGLRRFGSAALDLAFTACGRLDGYWELHLEPWDVAGGILLAREAGALVTDFAGDPTLDTLLHGRNIVAANPVLQPQLRALLAPLRDL